MGQEDWVANEIAPWLQTVGALERWRRDTGAPGPSEDAVAELRELLEALARRKVAVPVEMPVPGGGLESLAARADTSALLARWRARRAALLKLGVWQVLHALQMREDWGPHAMASLQAAMGRADARVPPGLSPALGYAGSDKAREFFGHAMRQTLQQLARRHAGHAALLERLHAAGHDIASVAGAQAWSEAWSVGIAANYLDCLDKKAGGSASVALSLVWGSDATRLHAVDGLLLLPARERHLHIDLWTDLVPAQALDHRHGRFAAPQPWHRVNLKMHDLGVREEGRARARIDRGISVDWLHLPVFANRARLALRSTPPDSSARSATHRTLVLDLPNLVPGQEANFQLVLRLQGTDGDPDVPRRVSSCAAPALDRVQSDIYAQWLEHEGLAAARELAATDIDWRAPGAAAQGDVDDADELDKGSDGDGGKRSPPGIDLGSGALWRATAAVGRAPQWLDVALVARRHGRWTAHALSLYARTAAGRLHCGLRLDAAEPAVDAEALSRALRLPGHARWVASNAGLGTFVMVSIDLDRFGTEHG